MFSKTTLGATVGLATGLIGFCIYYDQKRTNDPKYKENVEKSIQ